MNKRVKKNKKAVALLVALVVFLSLGGMAAAGQDWSNHWAGKQISCWLEKELITGYPDGSFQPDAAISRAEFFALINRLFGFEKQAAVYFADVTDGAWYQEDIAKALAAGYLSGYPDGTIRPNNPISRQEAAKVISLAFAYRESSPDGYSAFTDADQIGPWAREYVSLMTQKGIITGYPDGSFRPNQNISRAETVVMLSRAAGQIYNQAGVYSEDTNGNVFVNRGSITLQDMTIAGDLYLAEGIGEGEITLDRVTVQGNTIVKGGGIHSIIIKDCQFSKLIITKEDGKIRILATGSTTINETQLRSGAILEQEDISGEGFGYIVITESLDEDELIELVGDYDSVEIRAKGIQVQVSGGTIGNLEIAPEAANTNIKLAQGSQVTNLTANAPVTVTGKGTIQTALVNTDGTKIETPVAKLETAPGIKVDAKVEEPSPKSRGGGSTKTVPISAVIIVEDVAKVGETLTAKVTPDTATVRYQWQIAEREDGEYEDIDGATGKTYKPDGEDIDKYIRVVVKGYGSYSGTKTSAAVGPVGAPEYSIYKLSYADLADSYVVVDSLIGTDEWGKAINNTEVEQAISGLTPVKLTLETEIEGKNGYGSVRIKPVEAGENIQFWAKDEDGGGNWYNINISGWGDPSGFELPAQYTATTHIYILSNKVGTYDLTVQLVKVGNNEVIAQVEGTIRIRDKERSEYGFEIEDADQVFVAGELLDSSGIIAGEDGVDTTGLTPVKVTLKAIQIKELGYEQVRVLPPDVTQTEGSGGQLQFWAYSEDDGLWFDAAVHGWGDGFELTPDYKKTTEVYVFADAAGTYEVTFKLVEWSESGQVGEPIATRTATITVISQEMAEEINKAKAAIKPSWEVGGVEPVDGDEALPSGVENVDYKVTIKTSYDDKEAAQASGRTVTTLFTIPDGVTVWYPVWKEGQLTYQSDSSGEVALGMEGHPLNENNIDADGVVYVALGETTETKFTVTIKLVDADEEWQGVVYGEQELEIKVPEVSEYGFEFEDNIEIIAGNILEESEYDSDGTELGGLTVSDLTPTTVTLKPTIENELGYKKVRILPLVVNGPTDNSMLQVWIYDSKDGKWYDMVQKGWGSQGTGFTLGANENKEMKVYVFADTSGTYTVTFKAVDTSDPENEIVIAEETTTIFAPFHFDAGTRTISKYEGDKENITIPAAVNGVSVKAIGEGAFEENQHIKTVTFAEGSQLKTIGKEAFKECNDLESITIPASVTSIGEGAFVRCKALKSVDIPENVTSIEDYTFYGCENLKSITIPGVKEIKFFALSDTALESITIPDGCKLRYRALSSNYSLTTIIMGSDIDVDGEALYVGPELRDRGFKDAYDKGGAGTYILQDGVWTKQ